MRIKQIYTLMITGVILLSFGITGCKKISSKSNEADTELLAAESVTSPEEQTEIITEAVTEAPTVVIKPTEALTEPVTVPTTEAVTETPAVVIKPTEAPTEPVTVPTTQALTEAPTEKSIWDYPFDVEAIRAQCIEWGEATGMKHITEVEGWGPCTPENSTYDMPEYIWKSWCGEKAASRVKEWIELSQTEIKLIHGGNPLEYFTIWLEVRDNGDGIMIYLLG